VTHYEKVTREDWGPVKDLRCSAWKLSRDAKEGVKETPLPDHIALRQPPDLPFPDQMHRLGTADRNHRLAAIRFLINRWSCSMTLSK
jgi:hypothetical protein